MNIENMIDEKNLWYIKFEEEKKKKYKKELKEKWWKTQNLSDCGKWTQEDMAVIFENQTLLHEIYGTNPQLNLTKEMMLNFAAPYLVNSETMCYQLELGLYYREGDKSKYHFELEDLCTRLKKITGIESNDEYCKYLEDKWYLRKTPDSVDILRINPKLKRPNNQLEIAITDIDFEIISDISNNAGYRKTSKQDEIKKTINECLSVLEKKNFFGDNENWILISPEIASQLNIKENYGLTQNLNHCGDYKNAKVYSTKLIPENRIILGFLSSKGFHGYSFKPYVLIAPGFEDGKLELKYAKKLYRGSAGHYATIEVQ
jgi:hypothetical protein